MADKNALSLQSPLVLAHQADVEAGDVSPLEGSSRHTSRSSLLNEQLSDLDLVSENGEDDGKSTVPIPTNARTVAANTNQSSAPQYHLSNTPSQYPGKSMDKLKTLARKLHLYKLRLPKLRLQGWRMGVFLGCCLSFLVLCSNIAIIAVGANSKSGYDVDGISTIYESNDASIRKLNAILHVLINMLSTALLSSSNYTMQVLSSPTRTEVNEAHAKGSWLDIGIPSPRNLRVIAKRRAALWLTLAISSVPLHLFYNASIFKITTVSLPRGTEYSIHYMDHVSKPWNAIRNTTDTGNWTGGEFWDMSDQWEAFYQREPSQRLFHGDLYLAIDREYC